MSSNQEDLSTIELQLLQKARHGEMNPYRLIPWQDGTLPEFWAAYQSLVSRGLFVESDSPASAGSKRVRLSAAGEALVQQRSCRAMLALQCRCEGRGYALPLSGEESQASAFLAAYHDILRDRPPPAAEYDQTAITEEDMVIRAGFLHERGDVAGKSVLLVGDADLLSICLALTGLPKRVLVIDIDVRVIDFVNATAKARGWDFLSARAFDVRLPFPQGIFYLFIYFFIFLFLILLINFVLI